VTTPGHEPHRAKKSLGQNFLIDGNLQRKIVAALGAGSDDEVLEIGPGRGALTRHLVGAVRHLILVELDDQLAASLEDTYGARPDVTVVHQDFLKTHVSDHTERPERLRVIGNIPYNVTAPILFKLLERPRPYCVVIMVQREVAHRMTASPGTSEYGALTVGVQSGASPPVGPAATH